MILANNELIRLELSNLLENLCPIFSDRDYKVREAAMQLFKTVILLPSLSNKKQLEPFYGLINVHLSFSMTHIIENIQYSSLKLLDILIEHIPELIRVHSYNIFENFIDQISKANLKGDKRTLKNDPYKMTSTQTWRHNVLSRLYKMLLIVSSNDLAKNKKNIVEPVGEVNSWVKTDACETLQINFKESRNCLISNYSNKKETPSLKIWFEFNLVKTKN